MAVGYCRFRKVLQGREGGAAERSLAHAICETCQRRRRCCQRPLTSPPPNPRCAVLRCAVQCEYFTANEGKRGPVESKVYDGERPPAGHRGRGGGWGEGHTCRHAVRPALLLVCGDTLSTLDVVERGGCPLFSVDRHLLCPLFCLNFNLGRVLGPFSPA